MDELDRASKRLKTARDDHFARIDAEMQKIDVEEKRLRDKFHKLEEKKKQCAAANGNVDASDDDLIEINAGGKIIAARRGVLCQLKETNLEALFSGRWEKKLTKDSGGRIFLDVNGDCFQAIVDWLNLLTISPGDEPPKPPSVDEEYMPILNHQLGLFTNSFDLTIDDVAGCVGEVQRAVEYLEINPDMGNEGLKDNMLRLKNIFLRLKQYMLEGIKPRAGQRMTRDGAASHPGEFIFDVLKEGGGITHKNSGIFNNFVEEVSEFIMEFKGNDEPATPNLDHFVACIKKVFGGTETNQCALARSKSYRVDVSAKSNDDTRTILYWRLSADTPNLQHPRKRKRNNNDEDSSDFASDVTLTPLSGEIGEAIKEHWKTLSAQDAQILSLEERFKEEEESFNSVACGNTCDIITLNVSGTIMATRRDTLKIAEDSMLAQQFDDTKWTEQGCAPKVKEWTPDDVANWAKGIDGIPDDVPSRLRENNINGLELLVLDRDGLKDIGVQRVGTVCLLLDAIGKLKKEASQDVVTLIEHSPYCFGKILDYLRMKRSSSVGLSKEPAPPIVCEHKKDMFEKVVKYYFPGDSSDPILG